MTYSEVGEVDAESIDMLKDWLEEAQWKETRFADRLYETWYVSAAGVEEILPVFQNPMQQFFLKIPPGGNVHKHVDARKGITYHVPVTTNEHCLCHMYPDDKLVEYHLEVGKVYCVNRDIQHSSENLGSSDRIHLLVEVAHALPNRTAA